MLWVKGSEAKRKSGPLRVVAESSLTIMPGPRWRSAASLLPICGMYSSARSRADCSRTAAGRSSDEIPDRDVLRLIVELHDDLLVITVYRGDE